VTRNNDSTGLTRMFEYVVVAAVALDPTVSPQPCGDLIPVRLGFGHGDAPMRKYWRIRGFQSINLEELFAA
jgi:hypothetical protein